MEEPIIAQKGPYAVEVEEGKSYFWCACGRSGSQPFCDEAHKATSFKTVQIRAEKSETLNLCGCKHTHTPPFCDGTHKTL